ncbi:endonuclease/exonuclease/phosphatase family protein [Anaerocolumna xylanovorans]|uniref:Metal-dependent hydrolase, endonuclease/exonuclease/phosphatase family n=1 Tax=Anaerocolumna xylanovorans DSM 12503 TaxID=1121345 RepID=A0A1M7XYZ3_9FIRM|nr:endonuclease/exonuclease/phosphatase family protein [Anaerocolumna xylanovorans]SHO44318.1 Metal-dependent hydrolase, endonuclease/exonuclease/phosphatase family [Anaerocolumna xylanovorans DSM 12503]
MQIVTFNIRCDYGQDGANNFKFRKDLILKKINSEQPDILCFQEVLPHVALWLKGNLTDYYLVGCGRESNLEGEETSVAYRKDKYNIVKMEVFWLSDTPEIPGSRYTNQSECPRTCTCIYFQELETGKVFRVYNTHLDHIGSDARKQGLSLILKKISQADFLGKIPVIITGDFNAFPESEELAVLEDYQELYDCTKELDGTFHDFGTLKEFEKIDYIIADKNFSCKKVSKWTDCEDNIYLSDHYPVSAVLEF